MSSIARDHYCVPATSASSERAFSQAGQVVTDRRMSLNTSTIEQICFVNQNFPLLKSFVEEWNYNSAPELMARASQDSQDSDIDLDQMEIDLEEAGQDFLGPTLPIFTPRSKRSREESGNDPGAGPSGTQKKQKKDPPRPDSDDDD